MSTSDLLNQDKFCRVVGITHRTLHKWAKRGWIEPERVDGCACARYRVPSQERLAELRQLSQALQIEGLRRGIARSVAVRAENQLAASRRREEQGLVSRCELARHLKMGHRRIRDLVAQGVLVPDWRSNGGKHAWFQVPSDEAIERLKKLPRRRRRKVVVDV